MKRKYTERKIYHVWRSYSDMMAGLLLLFILVMSIALVSFQKSYEAEVQARKEEVQARKEEVQARKKQEALSKEMEEQKKIMEEQQEKIDKIIGIKAELIANLNGEFQANNLNVRIDEDTGAIIFDANVLFAYNDSTLTEEGKNMLNIMLPIYCKTLLQDKYLPYLSQIMIDGFTDSKGSFEFNLDLSQRRALAVARHLLNIEHTFLNDQESAVLESKLSANGRSKNNLIYDEQGNENADVSRRVEVKFRLTDEEMIRELQEILER